ncbi:hypothetical protein J6590_065436 [Homalodisca vitripennis]|nr:hypothetical protein J6590_089239 [Homalodisca vitripennis]KAG8320558.1 hypothetical protein J6590_065436 [Homalodisca vitripennis]
MRDNYHSGCGHPAFTPHCGDMCLLSTQAVHCILVHVDVVAGAQRPKRGEYADVACSLKTGDKVGGKLLLSTCVTRRLSPAKSGHVTHHSAVTTLGTNKRSWTIINFLSPCPSQSISVMLIVT